MPLALRDDLYFCLTDRCAIFLDLAANRYFGLSGTADIALRRIIAGDQLDGSLQRDLRPLITRGLLFQAERLKPILPTRLAAPTGSAWDSVAAPPIRTRLAALARHLAVRIEVRLFGLKAMASRRRERKARQCAMPASPAITRTLPQLLGAHRAVDRLVGGADRCLARSFALIDHLAAHGFHPDLVIGVRTSSFAAHCWVQDGTAVLNDDVDRVRIFTPIMVL